MVYISANGSTFEVEMYHLLSVKEQIEIDEWIKILNENQSQSLTYQKDGNTCFVMIKQEKNRTLFFTGVLESQGGNIMYDTVRVISIEI